MRDDERFEVERSMDQLPHVAGASFATVGFRMAGNRKPSAEEFRARAAEHFEAACLSLETFPDTAEFAAIKRYVRRRIERETERIMQGQNGEIEKRYERYLDYG